MTMNILKHHLTAAASAELLKRHGIAIPIQQAVQIGSQIADAILAQEETPTPPVKEPDREYYDLNQAMLVMDQEIDDVLQKLNGATNERHFWQGRLESCRQAMKLLKRFNLPNPPAA